MSTKSKASTWNLVQRCKDLHSEEDPPNLLQRKQVNTIHNEVKSAVTTMCLLFLLTLS